MKVELKMVLVLFSVAIVSAGLLSFVYENTSKVIEQQKIQRVQRALRELLPQADRFEEKEKDVLWIGYKGNKKIGIVFKIAPKGYGGPIETMVGVDLLGKITGVRFASAAEGLKETPGLGMRILEPWFIHQFKDKKEEDLYIQKEGGKIQAITAATITSKAVTDGIREGLKKYKCYLKNNSSKSEDTKEEKKKDDFKEIIKEVKEVLKIEPSKIKDGVYKVNKNYLVIEQTEGFSGNFWVVVIFDKEKKIKRVYIPSYGFYETEGFGTRCKEEEFLKKFEKKKKEEIEDIEGVTGATITSEAVKKAVLSAFAKLN